jgi:hypothetical protein
MLSQQVNTLHHITSVADPGFGIRDISGSGIRDEHPGSYFREFRKIFRIKILKFFDANPGSGIFLTRDSG